MCIPHFGARQLLGKHVPTVTNEFGVGYGSACGYLSRETVPFKHMYGGKPAFFLDNRSWNVQK
jgi:hypothetical protein